MKKDLDKYKGKLGSTVVDSTIKFAVGSLNPKALLMCWAGFRITLKINLLLQSLMVKLQQRKGCTEFLVATTCLTVVRGNKFHSQHGTFTFIFKLP